MRKTLTYVVTLLVCLGLVGAVWAGKPGGKKTKEGVIPVTVTFRDLVTPDDLIKSDGMGFYSDGMSGVAATISGGPSHPGRLRFDTGKERTLTLNFGLPDFPDCAGGNFPSMDNECRTVANLILLNEWEEVAMGDASFLMELDNRLNLLAMTEGEKTFVGFQIGFPSQLKRKINYLRFGWFGGVAGTVKRGTGKDLDHTWTLEAVELDDILSIAELWEANTNSAKGATSSKTGSGSLPFLITVVCKDPTQCVAPSP